MDYYKNIKKDPTLLKEIEERLNSNGDPVSGIDPDFDVDNNTRFENGESLGEASRVTGTGKVVDGLFKVSPNNFVPGDWAYFLNTDRKSYDIRGYEGSNSIYLGRDKFDDYYYEHGGSYSKQEKLEEIYNWRFLDPKTESYPPGFTPPPLTENQRKDLNRYPHEGGVVENYRWVPFFFGADPLPPLE